MSQSFLYATAAFPQGTPTLRKIAERACTAISRIPGCLEELVEENLVEDDLIEGIDVVEPTVEQVAPLVRMLVEPVLSQAPTGTNAPTPPVSDEALAGLDEPLVFDPDNDIADITFNGETRLISGGLSWGDSPTNGFDALVRIDALGLFDEPFTDWA